MARRDAGQQETDGEGEAGMMGSVYPYVHTQELPVLRGAWRARRACRCAGASVVVTVHVHKDLHITLVVFPSVQELTVHHTQYGTLGFSGL